jgi:pimeloyl-ACP methyl ester carboxylesterase
MKKYLLFGIALFLSFNSNAQLVSYSLQLSYTVAQLDSFFTATGFTLPVPPQYDIDVYQVIYKTPYKDIDSLVNVSGIVVFPKNTTCPSGLGCYAHGSFSRWDQVPSYNGPERPIGFFFAGIGGVVTAMPDELGLGLCDSSVLIHTYINKFHSGYASINIMRAARQLADTLDIPLSGEVALTGYSQGGYTTMATAKLIQEEYSGEFNVVALAPMSGPYDLNVTMVDLMLSNEPYATPGYLPYLLLGYHSVYPSLSQLYPTPSDVFKYPYDSIIPPMLYSRDYTLDDVAQFCTQVPRQMIKDNVISEFENDLNHPLRQILAENDLLGWSPQKPVKIAYCTLDEQVPYLNAVHADSAWRANNAPDIQIENFGDLNHGGCVQPALTSSAFYMLGKFSSCSAGIQETKAISFTLYPNPSTGDFIILKEAGVFQISIFNINGQGIYHHTLMNDIESISLENIPAGIYSVELSNMNGLRAHRKLVVH